MKKLSDYCVKLISTSQVITSIFNVVKELVENSLDSGSNNIDVRLEIDGVSKIEVQDYGSGISSSDIPFTCKQHYTSKIIGESDLLNLKSFGFRGEALFALCSLSNVSITTKTVDDFVANMYTFSCTGDVLSTEPTHHGNGTIVTVVDLFKHLPVRKQLHMNKRKLKEEIKHIEELLASYGILKPDLRLTLSVDRRIIWRKDRAANLPLALSSLFGLSIEKDLTEFNSSDDHIQLNGFLSNPGISNITANRMFVYVNNRPVKLKEINKMLKAYYTKHCCRGCNTAKSSLAVIFVNVQSDGVDVNVEPNKMSVLIENKQEVLEKLQNIVDGIMPSESNDSLEKSAIASLLNGPITNSDTSTKDATTRTLVTKDDRCDTSDIQSYFTRNNEMNGNSSIDRNFSENMNSGQHRSELSIHESSDSVTMEKMRQHEPIDDEIAFLPSAHINAVAWSRGSKVQTMPVEVLKCRAEKRTVEKEDPLQTNTLHFDPIQQSPPKPKRTFHSNRTSVTVDYHPSIHKINIDPSLAASHLPRMQVIGGIPAASLWFVVWNDKLVAVDKARLCETILYQQLHTRHKLSCEKLARPIKLNSDFLGHECYEMLKQIPTDDHAGTQGRLLNDVRITNNGFHLRYVKNSNTGEDFFECTHLNQDVAGYGLDDLIGILHGMKEEGDQIVRSDRAKQWLKCEATRLSRASLTECSKEDVQQYLEKCFDGARYDGKLCIHGAVITKMLNVYRTYNGNKQMAESLSEVL